MRCAIRCSCRWFPGVSKAPGWVWRWRRKSRANMRVSSATAAVRATRRSPCCCRWSMRMAEVWIADDDQAIRFVLGEALREAGREVREFADAETLLAALQ